MNNHHKQYTAPFEFVQEFNASKKRVFNAFASAEALNEWWGPVETKNTVIRLDFRPGGIFHYKMQFKESVSYGRFIYGRIEPFDLLEFTNSFCDENAKLVDPPFQIAIPREIFYRIHFTERNKKTTITLTGEPIHGSEAQLEGFRSISSSMTMGFGKTFDQLSKFLDKNL
jgi:uncharacterized protein YndB with AHSA1/START domain